MKINSLLSAASLLLAVVSAAPRRYQLRKANTIRWAHPQKAWACPGHGNQPLSVLVALPVSKMQRTSRGYAACGRPVTLEYQGRTIVGYVGDACLGCPGPVVSKELFQGLAQRPNALSLGVLHDARWSFSDADTQAAVPDSATPVYRPSTSDGSTLDSEFSSTSNSISDLVPGSVPGSTADPAPKSNTGSTSGSSSPSSTPPWNEEISPAADQLQFDGGVQSSEIDQSLFNKPIAAQGSKLYQANNANDQPDPKDPHRALGFEGAVTDPPYNPLFINPGDFPQTATE